MTDCIKCPYATQLRRIIDTAQKLHDKVWDNLISEKEFNLLQGSAEIDQIGDALDGIRMLQIGAGRISWLWPAFSLPVSDIPTQGKKGSVEPKKPNFPGILGNRCKYPNDPVFQGKDLKWYFWDEVWANHHGPYDTGTEVDEALVEYIRILGECR